MDAPAWRRFLRGLAIVLLLAGAAFSLWYERYIGPRPRGPVPGEHVADFALPDLDGRSVSLSQVARGRKAVVLIFSGTDCPVGNLYVPRLTALARRYGQRVAFLAINANAHEDISSIKRHATEHAINFPVLKDWNNKLADRLRIERVGEVLLLDGRGRLRYRGAVDDQYARGAYKPEPTRHYLAEALDAVLAGKPVAMSSTAVVTCPIDRVAPERARRTLRQPSAAFASLRRGQLPEAINVGSVTYAQHAATILREKCQLCHRPGEVAPFSLLSYDDARRWGESIYEVVEQGLMPPWHADPRYGHFTNDRSLTERERATLLAWVDQGMPAGELDKAPPPADSRQGWTIGQPDIVFEMPEPYDVPAEGTIPVRKFTVPTGFKNDVWVAAAQAMPGDRAVVHHVCVFIIDPSVGKVASNDRERMRRDMPELVCYAPGDMPSVFPAGVAKRIPAGAALEIQVHYQPVGVPRFDRTAVGLRLARGVVERLAQTVGVSNRDFVLAPGAANVEVRASYTLGEDGELLNMTPHMHYRGRDFRYELVSPDGRRQMLLLVPCYDFNWQNVYRLAEPISFTRGTRIECVAHFDNSSGNPLNPDPRREVRWGEQSTDEMMIGYFDYCTLLAQPRMAHGPRDLERR